MLNIEKLNQEAVENGVWVDFSNEIQLKIASTRNKAYRDAAQKAAKKLPKNRRTWSPKQVEDMSYSLVANYILLDWKGVKDTKTGKAVKYTPEEGEKALRDYQLLREFIDEMMASEEIFIEEYREQAVKN